MTVLNAEAGAISFAHLAGITTPVHAAKADAPEDEKDDKDAKADDDSDDASAEDDSDKKEDAKAETDEPEDDDKKDGKAKKASASGVYRGVAQERARWTAIVSSKSFARNPALGAHMLANTSMDASAILSVLRDAPAASAPDAGRAGRNPNLGVSAPAVAASANDRWAAAMKRSGILK